ncbi:hypothetical protein E2562_000169 [Oryza meyeriana var. granulata]|uniref:Reverse transcriptase Ty1/copia-type domain-containing protein n=1 Tax=Oryza meyeriana var. granulata TaxID=110450 RepID=A0A6G1DBR1_9ORYZ|nr:hypothetical protein E2562_000169 [Oryza meyeriana var. granulata]
MGAGADFVVEYHAMELGSRHFGADTPMGSPEPPPTPTSMAGTPAVKKNAIGEVIKHKARLVAKGYVQQPGVDFDKVFAPVAYIESVQLLLALATQEGWPVHHMDVKSAFLNSELIEEVYIRQPLGFTTVGHEDMVLRLDKALYGLRQAPRAWNAKFDETLVALGFNHSVSEHAVYARGEGASRLLGGFLRTRSILAMAETKATNQAAVTAATALPSSSTGSLQSSQASTGGGSNSGKSSSGDYYTVTSAWHYRACLHQHRAA